MPADRSRGWARRGTQPRMCKGRRGRQRTDGAPPTRWAAQSRGGWVLIVRPRVPGTVLGAGETV